MAQIPFIPPFCRTAYLTASRCVNEGPTLFFGIQSRVTVDGALTTIYSGNDVLSGSVRFNIGGWTANGNFHGLAVPVLFEAGLYVALAVNVTSVSVMYLSAEMPVIEQILREFVHPTERS